MFLPQTLMGDETLVTVIGVSREPDTHGLFLQLPGGCFEIGLAGLFPPRVTCQAVDSLPGPDVHYTVTVRTEDGAVSSERYLAAFPDQRALDKLNVDQLVELEIAVSSGGICGRVQMPVAFNNGRLPDEFPVRLYEAFLPLIAENIRHRDVL